MSAAQTREGGTPDIRPDGKAAFDDIYDQPTPVAYFSALRPLEYMAPGRVQPLVRRCIDALRRLRDLETVNVLDLCSGYGVNGALLKHRVTLRDLYQRFASRPDRIAGVERIAADALWFRRQRRGDADVRVIAQDVACNALQYSKRVGLADAVVPVNLESEEPTPEQEALMRDAHLIIVTGGMSYIGEKTFERLLALMHDNPWALYFPLRHTDTSDVDELFEGAGYVVEAAKRTIDHRRYRSEQERRAIHSRILAEATPHDPPPSAKYIEALVKLARPDEELVHPPFEEIAAGHQWHKTGGLARIGIGESTRSGP